MKMQVAFRRLIGQKFAGYDVAAAVGLFDMPAASANYDECVSSFHLPLMSDGSEPTSASSFQYPQPLSSVANVDAFEAMRYANVEDIIKTPINRPVPSEHSNAHFFFRKARVGSQFPGGSVYAFAGTFFVDDVTNLDCRDVLEFSNTPNSPSGHMQFEGRVGRTVRLEFGETDLVAESQGRPISQFLLEPIWGFGDTPIALGSTLRLDLQNCYENYARLFFAESRSVEEDQRYRQLRILVQQAGFTLLDKDPVLARVLWRIRGNEDYISPFMPKTRDEFKAANNAMANAFEAIERGEEDTYFQQWRREQEDAEAVIISGGYN
jgi:hypothetical protein